MIMDKTRINVWMNDQWYEKKWKFSIDDHQERKEYRLVTMSLPKVAVHNICDYRDISENS